MFKRFYLEYIIYRISRSLEFDLVCRIYKKNPSITLKKITILWQNINKITLQIQSKQYDIPYQKYQITLIHAIFLQRNTFQY